MKRLFSRLLRPGEIAMDQLRFSQKILLVVLLLLIPATYVTYHYTVGLNQAIALPRQQRVGMQFVRAAGDFIKEVQRHRGTASRLLNGDASAKQALTGFQADAAQAIARLDSLDATHGAAFGSSAEWEKIKDDWEALLTVLPSLPPAKSFEMHTDVVTAIQRFAERVSDRSSLSMNSHLDEYHLSILTTQTLSRLSEVQGQERAAGSGVATKGSATQEEKTRIQILKAQAEAYLSQAQTSVEQAVLANPALAERLEAKTRTMTDLANSYQALAERELIQPQTITIAGATFFDEATVAIDSVFALRDEAFLILDELMADRIREVEVRRAGALGLIALTMLVAAYFLMVFAISARRNLSVLEAASRQMMQGDFRIERVMVASKDEIGQVAAAFNQTIQFLRQLIAGVTDSARSVQSACDRLSGMSEQAAHETKSVAEAVAQVADGAELEARSAADVQRTMTELKNTIRQIEQGSQQMASEVLNASTGLEQMSGAIAGVDASARRVAERANQAAVQARDGANVVQQTLVGMSRIQRVVDETAERIRTLGQVSAKIGEITGMISEIAEQTNLLALNAAIEAARAGEHGRGFAVVADEVRKLAERSTRSTREIATLLNDVQTRMVDAAQSMEQGTTEAATGSRLAAESGRVLEEILTTVEQAATGVQSISETAQQVRQNVEQGAKTFGTVAAVAEESTASTEEMSASASTVSEAMERVSKVSQENARAVSQVSSVVESLNAVAREVAASARELAGISVTLQAQVEKLKV